MRPLHDVGSYDAGMARTSGNTRLVAREEVWPVVDELLAGDERAGLLFTGPAGIGKTAIWEAAVARARDAGWRVLSARCTAAEAVLPWVGVTDLLEHCPEQVWERLPAPQRDALDVIMLRARACPGVEPPDERAVGMALLSILNAGPPALLAVDDVGHLDPASAKAIRFAFRRLKPGAPVRVVATARERHAFEELRELPVGPLSLDGIYQLVRDRVGTVFSRPTLTRIFQTSGGNSLYALEIARALERREIHPVPGTPLGLPDTLRSLLGDRMRQVGLDTRLVVAATATANRLPVAQFPAAALHEASREALVDIEEGFVRAAHPVLASAAYSSLSDVERSGLHRALARESTDPIERARHLAVAVPAKDDSVAAALDEATATAAARGAVDAAADLARLAVERATTTSTRRLQTLADMLLRAGDAEGAVTVQREAVNASPRGDGRARELIRLAEFEVEAASWNDAVPLLRRAIAEPGIHPLVAAEAHMTIAAVSYDDLRSADEHAQRAAAIVEAQPDPDPHLLSGVLTQAAGAGFRAGSGLDHERFRRAMELERRGGTRRLSDRADASYAALLKYSDDLDGAEHLLTKLLAEAESSGDLSSIAYVRSHLPQLALFRGDIATGRELAEAYLTLAEQAGLVMHVATARFLTSLVAAYDGRVAEAGPALEAELATAEADDNHWNQQRIRGALGFLTWSQGDARAAVAHLDEWYRLLELIGLADPGYARYHLDYAEALVANNRLADATRFLDALDVQATRTGRAYALAVSLTGRAVVKAAQGDGGEREINEALRRYDALPLRFDRARCLLIAGAVRRRARAKRGARDAFLEAEREFTDMGAPLWAGRAAEFLKRVNIRPPSSSDLTETERRVAELAAKGWTNREVAAATFMSPKTVEANLSRAYRKLGISSRAELGARLGRPPDEE